MIFDFSVPIVSPSLIVFPEYAFPDQGVNVAAETQVIQGGSSSNIIYLEGSMGAQVGLVGPIGNQPMPPNE